MGGGGGGGWGRLTKAGERAYSIFRWFQWGLLQWGANLRGVEQQCKQRFPYNDSINCVTLFFLNKILIRKD